MYTPNAEPKNKTILVTGAAVYVGGSVVFKLEPFQYVLGMLNKFRKRG